MIASSPTNSIPDLPQRQVINGGVTRTGNLMKLGDGLMNRTWNPRYFMLRGSSLQYFSSSRDVKPREVVDLLNAEVLWLGDYLDRSNCVVIEPAAHRTLHLSGASLEEAKQWLRWFQEAADPEAYASLPPAVDYSSAIVRESEFFMDPVAVEPNRPALLSIPTEIPSHLSEVGEALAKFVNQPQPNYCDMRLVDVSEGIRIFSNVHEVIRMKKHRRKWMTVVCLGLAAVFLGSVLSGLVLVAMFFAYRIFFGELGSGKSEAVTGGIATMEVSPRGLRNWLLDASRHPLWIPNLGEAFSNPGCETEGGGDTHDYLHYVFLPGKKKHVGMRRYWWEDSKDGSFCIVARQIGGNSIRNNTSYQAWCLKQISASRCRVWLLAKGCHVEQSLLGLSRIISELGDHEGLGIPKLVVNSTDCWILRHWRGGLAVVRKAQDAKRFGSINSKPISKQVLSSVMFGRQSIGIMKSSSIFPQSDVSPLRAVANIFSGFSGCKMDSDSDLVAALLRGMPQAVSSFAQCAWTKLHAKVGDSLNCYIGGGGSGSNSADSSTVFASLEAVETSRPSQGLFASISVKLTSDLFHWTCSGTIKYTLLWDSSQQCIRLSFAGSQLTFNDSFFVLTNFPDVLLGVGSDKRAFPVGVLRILQHHNVLHVLHFEECGKFFGCQFQYDDDSGSGPRSVEGHWLESLYIDNELVWTLVPLHQKTDEVKQVQVAAVPRMSSADEDASSFIQSLRSRIPEMQIFQNRFTDRYLYRFSKARQFDFMHTCAMIRTHISWLEEHEVVEKSLTFIYTELPRVKAAFPHGYHGIDKFMRPIYISRLAETDQDALFHATNWERFIKYWIQSYEELIWRKVPICEKLGGKNPHLPGLPPPSSLAPLQTLTILDIRGIGLSQLNSRVREFISVTSKIASDNYPEILGTMYIVNSPAVFPMIWNAVKGMIDPGTRAKTHVVNVKQTTDKLLEVIAPDQLPFFLGGSCKCDPASHDKSDFGCLSSDKGPWNNQT